MLKLKDIENSRWIGVKHPMMNLKMVFLWDWGGTIVIQMTSFFKTKGLDLVISILPMTRLGKCSVLRRLKNLRLTTPPTRDRRNNNSNLWSRICCIYCVTSSLSFIWNSWSLISKTVKYKLILGPISLIWYSFILHFYIISYIFQSCHCPFSVTRIY